MTSDLTSFMATMIARSCPLTIERAAALARESYGLETRAARLSGERDENFKLTADDGTEYLLKIAHAAEQRSVSELPIAALQHVARSDPALPCPRVIPARSGASQTPSWFELVVNLKTAAALGLRTHSRSALEGAAWLRAPGRPPADHLGRSAHGRGRALAGVTRELSLPRCHTRAAK